MDEDKPDDTTLGGLHMFEGDETDEQTTRPNSALKKSQPNGEAGGVSNPVPKTAPDGKGVLKKDETRERERSSLTKDKDRKQSVKFQEDKVEESSTPQATDPDPSGSRGDGGRRGNDISSGNGPTVPNPKKTIPSDIGSGSNGPVGGSTANALFSNIKGGSHPNGTERTNKGLNNLKDKIINNDEIDNTIPAPIEDVQSYVKLLGEDYDLEDNIYNVACTMHAFEEMSGPEICQVYRHEMLAIHSELREWKRQNTILNRQIHVLSTQLKRASRESMVVRTLMCKDMNTMKEMDDVVKQAVRLCEQEQTQDDVKPITVEVMDRIYNALQLTTMVWNQRRAENGQRKVTLPEFPKTMDNQILHQWDDYNESVAHVASQSEVVARTDLELQESTDAKKGEHIKVFDLTKDFVKAIQCQVRTRSPSTEGQVTIEEDSKDEKGYHHVKEPENIPLSNMVARQRSKRIQALMDFRNRQHRKTAGQLEKRLAMDSIDEVATFLSALEKPTCVGMLDHHAMHIRRIQHKVRLFLARRRRMKSELVQKWYFQEKQKARPVDMRLKQLRLFCLENDIQVDALMPDDDSYERDQTRSSSGTRGTSNYTDDYY